MVKIPLRRPLSVGLVTMVKKCQNQFFNNETYMELCLSGSESWVEKVSLTSAKNIKSKMQLFSAVQLNLTTDTNIN